MIFRRLVIFLLILVLGIVAGVFIINYAARQFSMPKGITDFILVAYVGIFLIISLVLGKDIPREPGDEDKDEDIPRRKPGMAKEYAWFLPTSGKTRAGYPVTRKLMIIGRDVKVDILINDPSVSKKHAQLLTLPGGYQLKDLESTNGTFINNQRIQEAFIGEGDMVTFGEMKFMFTCAKAMQPSEEGEGPISVEIELSEDLSKASTATFPTGSRTSAPSVVKSGSQAASMPFKTPKGFNEDDEGTSQGTTTGGGWDT